MTNNSRPHGDLSILVERFAAFLKEQRKHPELAEPHSVPPILSQPSEIFGHHLVVLMLLAKSDDAITPSEREKVFDYCVARARKAGAELNAEQTHALDHYLQHHRPAEIQLTPALERLKHDSKEDLASLIAAAHAVVEADGVVRLNEAIYLNSLLRDLHAS